MTSAFQYLYITSFAIVSFEAYIILTFILKKKKEVHFSSQNGFLQNDVVEHETVIG